jgi:hypothetical protein
LQKQLVNLAFQPLSFRRWLRFTAAATAIAFSTLNLSYAQTALPVSEFIPASHISFENGISIPENLGKIESFGLSKDGKPFLIFIQDAHAVVDAQSHIEQIIQHLQEHYGVQVIAVEGSQQKLDPTLLRTFPDEKVRKKVLSEYVERGELGGAELAAINKIGRASCRERV